MSYPTNKPRIDLAGQSFGRLTVIQKTDRSLHGSIVWECKCDCGNTRFVPTTSLNSGNTTSCGCLTKENQRSAVALPEGEAALNRVYKNYRDGAKKYNREFLLSREEFRALTSQNCFYCKQEPNQTTREPHFNGVYMHNGIDRVDSTMGYAIDNCVPCCKTCNIAKHTMTTIEFAGWINRAYQHFASKYQET